MGKDTRDRKMSVAEYIEMAKEMNKGQGIVVQDIRIEEELIETRKGFQEIIDAELEDYFVLLDLGITAIIEMHNICKEKKNFLYICISGKLISQLLSMRILLYQGMMDSVKTINRSFHEMMEIFFACLIDKEFAEEYGRLDVLYDNNKFWREKINGNKLDECIKKMFSELGYPREAKKEYFKRKKKAESFLSESVHASLNSSFSAYMMPTLNWEYSTNIYGKITTAYPLAMYEILKDICLINAVFFLAVDKEKAFAFKREDFIGEKCIRYHYYMKLYDVAYDFYYQDLHKKGMDISNTLNEVYEYFKRMESEGEEKETNDL